MKALKNLIFATKKAIALLPSRKEKRMVILLWSLTLSSYFISVFFPAIQMWITDGAGSLIKGNGQYSLILLGFLGLLVSILIDYIGRRKSFALSEYVSSLIKNNIYGDMLKKSVRLKYKYFDEKEMYDKFTQASKTVPERIASLITWNTIPPILGGIISMVFVTASLCYVHWSIAVLTAIGNGASVFFYYKRMKNNYFLQIQQIPQKRWAETYWRTLVSKETLKEISIFRLSDYLTGKWKEYSLMTARQNFGFSIKYSAILLWTDSIAILFKIMALILTVCFIMKGRASIGAFMLVYGSIHVFSGYLSDISKAFINISENSLYICDWLEYMNLEEEKTGDDPEEKERVDALPGGIDFNIEFSDVSFRYSGSEKLAVERLSLKIQQGEKIAVVGKNGSGKSTFVALLNGLYDDYKGQILVNGQDSRKNLQLLRNNIVTAFQDYGCYEFSVKENICMGGRKRAYTDAEIHHAAELADAAGFIDKLEEGLNTEIGSYAENGINLSGGEWQKIALARTFLDPESKVIILDEPTAALDPFSESAVYRRFMERTDNQTVIMISHRLGATKFADRVLVFDEGKIVEEGKHEELMKKKGLYWDMYTLQSGLYKEAGL